MLSRYRLVHLCQLTNRDADWISKIGNLNWQNLILSKQKKWSIMKRHDQSWNVMINHYLRLRDWERTPWRGVSQPTLSNRLEQLIWNLLQAFSTWTTLNWLLRGIKTGPFDGQHLPDNLYRLHYYNSCPLWPEFVQKLHWEMKTPWSWKNQSHVTQIL